MAWSVAVCRMNTNRIRWRTDRQGGRRRGFRRKKILLFPNHKLTKLYLPNFNNIYYFGLDGPDFELQQKKEVFSTPDPSRRLCGPRSLVLSRYLGSFPGVKRSRHEVAHWPSCRAEVKNEWICSSAPSIRLHGVDRSNFTFPSLVTYFCHFLHKVRFDGFR